MSAHGMMVAGKDAHQTPVLHERIQEYVPVAGLPKVGNARGTTEREAPEPT